MDMQEDNLSYWPLPSTLSQGLLYTRLPDLHFPRVLQVSFPTCHGAQGLQILAFNWFYESELICFAPSHLLILEAPISNGGEKICNSSFDSRARNQCFLEGVI